jgi:hypothetical protein
MSTDGIAASVFFVFPATIKATRRWLSILAHSILSEIEQMYPTPDKISAAELRISSLHPKLLSLYALDGACRKNPLKSCRVLFACHLFP